MNQLLVVLPNKARTNLGQVDMTGLKELARNRLPETSMLRKLIEREKDSIDYREWLSKMEVYGRLLEEETS